MFTRSIVIQRRVEDLQLGVESYQKRLNLTKPDTYRPDLKRREAYTAYSNPRGFIYQNKDKKNILMRIDELYKFSDGTLNDVRNALDDRLKGIQMQSTTGSQSRQMSASESAFAEEPVQTTCQMEEPPHPVFETGADDQPIVQTSQHPEWFSQPKRPPSPDRAWNTTIPAAQGDAQSCISDLARETDARSSFNELIDTHIDFFNFIMNRLNVDTLTPDLLAGPTYELMRGSCTSLTDLEYHLEEVYEATTDQLDWVNLEGQQYPHNLLQPLPLIPDNRGRRVIPFEHFINNDLEYLRGGALSRKYTTFVTKTKAADYGHIKWIEDLVPRAMWIQQPIDYNRHDLWEVSHWGRKRKQFYEYAVNRESARYSVVMMTRFTKGDFKRLRLQDIEDMLLLLKRLNLTKLDTYRPDLRRREAYTAHLNPRGFIYQNKDKKNRLMRIDELHKFSDGMLNDVRNALDDRLKGIRCSIREVLLMLKILSRRYFLKLNLSDHREHKRELEIPDSS
nr:hypothetical protein [Tanacetum cinerariifolium]